MYMYVNCTVHMYCTCTVHVADGTYVRYSFYFSNRSTYMYVLCFEMIIDSLNNLRKVRSFMYIKVPTVLHHGIPTVYMNIIIYKI